VETVNRLRLDSRDVMTQAASDTFGRRSLLWGALGALVGAGCGESSGPRPTTSPVPESSRPKTFPGPVAIENGDSGLIRVCLAESLTTASIRTTGGYSVIPLWDHYARGFPQTNELTCRRSGSVWKLNHETFEAEYLQIRPLPDSVLWLGDRGCRGEFWLSPVDDASFRVVNELPLEEYVASVVDGEMPADFPIEARKAQAVAARTFAALQRRQATGAAFDVFASAERAQKYLGYQYRDAGGRLLAGESPSSRQAVAETQGLVCTRGRELFRTYYSACCGGKTTAGSLVFPDAAELRGVACGRCEDCPRYAWSVTIGREPFLEALAQATGAGRLTKIADVSSSHDGKRDRYPLVTASSRNQEPTTVTTAALRAALGSSKIPSPWFSVKTAGEDVILTGRGHGHGVGLCQWGARGMALSGADFQTILKRYYSDCDVIPLISLPESRRSGS
jgi:stage II sporulation protein D